MNEMKVFKSMVTLVEELDRKTGKVWQNFMIETTVRGKKFNIEFRPAERNSKGYGLALLVFNEKTEAELRVGSRVNYAGEIVPVYTLVSKDEDGVELTCEVRFKGSSDEHVYGYMVKKYEAALERESAEMEKEIKEAVKEASAKENAKK